MCLQVVHGEGHHPQLAVYSHSDVLRVRRSSAPSVQAMPAGLSVALE